MKSTEEEKKEMEIAINKPEVLLAGILAVAMLLLGAISPWMR